MFFCIDRCHISVRLLYQSQYLGRWASLWMHAYYNVVCIDIRTHICMTAKVFEGLITLLRFVPKVQLQSLASLLKYCYSSETVVETSTNVLQFVIATDFYYFYGRKWSTQGEIFAILISTFILYEKFVLPKWSFPIVMQFAYVTFFYSIFRT